MSNSLVAIRYARAIWDLARSKKAEADVLRDMVSVEDTLKDSPDLNAVLRDPTIQGEIKKQVLLNIWKDSHTITQGLFETLKANGRLSLLDEVASGYRELHGSGLMQDQATVYSASPLGPEVLDQIGKKLQTISQKQIVVSNEIRPELIGGFVIRWGDMRYDASVSQQLSSLKREFTNSI